MQTRNKIGTQAATLVFALTMLTGYVVYSQLQSNRTVRALAPPSPAQIKTPAAASTNSPSFKVAPGSKAAAPLVELRAPGLTVKTTPPPWQTDRLTVFSGSKSGQIVQPQALQYEVFQPKPLQYRGTNLLTKPELPSPK
jgi:hypothetical protein